MTFMGDNLVGIDLGGTKIEAAVLDRRRLLLRERVPTPRGDYDGTLTAIAALVAGRCERARPHRGRHRHARCRSRRPPAGEERQLDLAQRPAARGDWRACSAGRCGCRTMPTAWRYPKRSTARRPAPRWCSPSSSAPASAAAWSSTAACCGRQRDRRRMGPQPPALAARRGVAGPGLLVRQARLHRDLAERAGARRRASA